MEKKDKSINDLKEKNEEYTKLLLKLEMVLGFTASITFLTVVFIASYIKMDKLLVVALITGASILFVLGIAYCLKIEQVAGYYKCSKCGHKYIPEYMSIFFAPHMGRTRYMSCPKCNEKSWQRKVID